MPKRMRLPNGFGQISQLKGRRLRNPWRAMVTIGWELDTGKPKRMTVGYYKSYNEAYQGLMEYHKDPYKPEAETTMQELYERWSEQHFKKIKPQSRQPYIAAWERCSEISNVLVKDIRVGHIKTVTEADVPPTAQINIRNLLNQMLDYAIEYDLAEKNYARLATINYKKKKGEKHVPFSEEELNILWENTDQYLVQIILFQCYTGFRPNELVNLEVKNVDLENWTIMGGMKTAAGTDRIVPIHERIRPFVKEWCYGNKLLKSISYETTFRRDYPVLLSSLGISAHKPHDGRNTFATRMREAGADPYATKRILGHAIEDLTERVYTRTSIEWLHREVAKMS